MYETNSINTAAVLFNAPVLKVIEAHWKSLTASGTGDNNIHQNDPEGIHPCIFPLL